jgi:hypothetical protein
MMVKPKLTDALDADHDKEMFLHLARTIASIPDLKPWSYHGKQGADKVRAAINKLVLLTAEQAEAL